MSGSVSRLFLVLCICSCACSGGKKHPKTGGSSGMTAAQDGSSGGDDGSGGSNASGGAGGGGMCVAEGMGCALASSANQPPDRLCCDGLDCSSQEGKCRPICTTDDDCPHTPLYLTCQGTGGPKHKTVCIFSNGTGAH